MMQRNNISENDMLSAKHEYLIARINCVLGCSAKIGTTIFAHTMTFDRAKQLIGSINPWGLAEENLMYAHDLNL